MRRLAFVVASTHAAVEYTQWSSNGTVDAGDGRIARLAADLIDVDEAAALVEVISTMEADLTALDSTDRLPAYETYVRDHGVDKHPIGSTLSPLWQKLTEYAREHYDCPECHLCSVLLRRYRPDERRRVHSHYDRNAIVTAVVSLNAGLQPPAFEGGFFLQRTARADSRSFLAANSTDAIFHSYDLNHGVRLFSGTRYSAIFWWSDSSASCETEAHHTVPSCPRHHPVPSPH